MAGLTARELAKLHPMLYHMAEAGSWPSIERHGLLSTTALLDLFQIGVKRKPIEAAHRPECVEINHRRLGSATIRDQKPMSDSGLANCLRHGLTPSQWYQTLNGLVFFWVSKARLDKLLGARAYRDKRQCILEVDALGLLEAHADRVLLSPINSGCTKPNPTPRGKDTFLPIAEYPYAEWRKRRGNRDVIVELAVKYSVTDIRGHVRKVYETGGGKQNEVLHRRRRG